MSREACGVWSDFVALDKVMPREPLPSRFLLTLFAISIFGVVVFNIVKVDPEGDGGGIRFVFGVILSLLIYGCFRIVGWISRGMRRDQRGFPIEPSPPRGEA